MKKFHEFTCLFDNGIDPVSGEPDFTISDACIDLMSVIAFNPFTLTDYTVLRLVDGTSFIVECKFDEMKKLMASNSIMYSTPN